MYIYVYTRAIQSIQEFLEKRKIHILQDFFFHIFKLCLFWNWFIAKIISISQKYVLRLFKMATNQTEYSRIEQRSVIKFLQADMCKPCEIYIVSTFSNETFTLYVRVFQVYTPQYAYIYIYIYIYMVGGIHYIYKYMYIWGSFNK